MKYIYSTILCDKFNILIQHHKYEYVFLRMNIVKIKKENVNVGLGLVLLSWRKSLVAAWGRRPRLE